jgi:TnpA family transposase
MSSINQEQATKACEFGLSDLQLIHNCRGNHNKLGYGYQLAFVRFFNRFPNRSDDKIQNTNVQSELQNQLQSNLQTDILLTQVASKLELQPSEITKYYQRQATISTHKQSIIGHLKLKAWNDKAYKVVVTHLEDQTNFNLSIAILVQKVEQLLVEIKVLAPATDQIERLVRAVVASSEGKLKRLITSYLSDSHKLQLDQLLLGNSSISNSTNNLNFTNDSNTSLPTLSLPNNSLNSTLSTISTLQLLKVSAGRATINSEVRLQQKLKLIKDTGILDVEFSWLNKNIRRHFCKLVTNRDIANLRKLEPENRYALLVCFLIQRYSELQDQSWNMHIKIMTNKTRRSEGRISDHAKKHRKSINSNLENYRKILALSVDEAIPDSLLRAKIFEITSKDQVKASLSELDEYFDKRYSDPIILSAESYQSFRKYTPALLTHLDFKAQNPEDHKSRSLITAVSLLKQLNTEGAKKIPISAPTSFVPSSKQALIYDDKGKIIRSRWEQILLTEVERGVASGSLFINNSTRYDSLTKFFIPKAKWLENIDWFFARNKLPKNPTQAVAMLANLLADSTKKFCRIYEEAYSMGKAYGSDKLQVSDKLKDNSQDKFQNGISKIINNRLHVPIDLPEQMTDLEKSQLDQLKDWLQKETRTLSLIEAFVEVNNDLNLTQFFVAKEANVYRKVGLNSRGLNIENSELTKPKNQYDVNQGGVDQNNTSQDKDLVCQIIATILAYATNTGLYTMARMTNIPYHRLRSVADNFDDNNLKLALSLLVKAMLENDVSKNWGVGKSSSSDGQRFPYIRNVLHSVFSNRLREFGGEFYSFVSDNYMPYASMPIECTERDANFLVNGINAKISELELEEHYTDTHGYTEINFAYFAMRGIGYKPRIKDVHKQKLYTTIDSLQGSGVLTDILKGNYIDLNNIKEYWHEIAHYFASLELGEKAANIGMKRIVSLTEKNKFYKAAKDLGRIYKTIHLLQYHSDPELRKRIKKGLNKGELIHSLGRKLAYGNEGKHSMPNLDEQQNTCSALTLTEAVIIYWQTKEIQRVVYERFTGQVNLEMLAHISPIQWHNILIYGEYKFDKKLIKIRLNH